MGQTSSRRSGRSRLAIGLANASGCPATFGLMVVCVGVFVVVWARAVTAAPDPLAAAIESIWTLGDGRASLLRAGALDLGRIWVDGQWWRAATTVFNHGSWLHLGLNIWSLWVVGAFAERAWGATRLLILFGVSGLLGSLAAVGYGESSMVVGASGGVLGIAGALWIGRMYGRGRTGRVLEDISAQGLGGSIAVLILLGFVVPVIAQAGHVGGLLGGAGLGLVWCREPGLLLRAMGLAGVLGLGVAACWPGLDGPTRAGHHDAVGYRLLQTGADREAAMAFERALAAEPGEPRIQNAAAYGFAKAGLRLHRAEGLVRAALAREPRNSDYLDTLGWVLCRQGRWRPGLDVLEEANARSEAPNPEILEHISRCYDAAVVY